MKMFSMKPLPRTKTLKFSVEVVRLFLNQKYPINFKRELSMLRTTIMTLVVSVGSVGCASITQSDVQPLSLTATYQDKPIEAECVLKNDKGSWSTKAPANVAVRKSGEDLEVTCKKEGMPDGLLKAISRAAGSMWGNIIFGGGIGAIIDHNKGTGYDYPDQLPVKMGTSVVVDKKPSEQTAQKACAPGQNC